MKKRKKPRHNLSEKINLSNAVVIPERDNSNVYIALVVILLITIIAYLPVFQNGLLKSWDDDFYIINNPLIKNFSWQGIKAIFSDFNWDIYCPLTFLIHAVLFKIGGINPVVFHFTSLVFHLLNTVLVFWFIKMICNRWEIAAITALLFGIHPMGVESVAWASAGTNIHYAALFLGSLIAYLYYLQQKQKRYLFISMLLFVLSSLSKAVAVVLPVVLLLIDYYKGRKITINVLLEKVPFLMISIGTGILTFLLKNKTGNVGDVAVFTLPTRALFASYGFVSYLIKLAFPLKLCAFYPYPVNSGNGIPIVYYAFMLIFAVLAVYIVYTIRFTKKIIFGMGFFTITILLVLQLLPVGKAIMADRYSYIPSIGIFYLAGEGLSSMINDQWTMFNDQSSMFNKIKWSRTFGITMLSVAAVLFTVKTYARCGVWKNDEILWSDVIDKYPMLDKAYYNRGSAYMNEKRPDEAIKDFNKAIEFNPKYAEAYNNRGFIFMNEIRNDEALNDFNKAIELKPNLVEAYNNRGIIFIKEIRIAEAIRDFNKAIEIEPEYAPAYYNRGILEYQPGSKSEACTDLKKAAGLGYKPAEEALSRMCK